MQPVEAHTEELLRMPCLCATLRRATRVVTQLYEEAFRPLGLTAPQYTVMAVLTFGGPMPHTRLGELLATDATTLTRTLQLMTRNGWIETATGQDRRQRIVSLTGEGAAIFERAKPVWQAVQQKLYQAYGTAEWSRLFTLVDRATEGALHVLGPTR
ncbi:MAG: winged helix DNA-binding protein [Bryobacterales bacterium]|nr:winged helix DNA-binding protein [Bryobacterales bacterium]